MTDKRWQTGDRVVVRYITRTGSRPGDVWPCRVVADREDLVAVYLTRGTRFKRAVFPPLAERSGGYALRHEDSVWGFDTLRLMYPDRGSSVWLFWDAEPSERRFRAWYVNMEEPFRRTSIGFDTNDHALDIVVTPELEWSWKDQEELDECVRLGLYTSELAAAVRAEGERMIEQVERSRSPFSEGWERWRPDPEWTIPELPNDWARVPPALWSRRRWAYGDASA